MDFVYSHRVYLQHLLLLSEAQYLRAHDAGAGLQGENGADKGLRLTLPLHHRCYLDHGVFVRLWEDSFKRKEGTPKSRPCSVGPVC